MAKRGGTSVIDTVAKMGGAHCGKNGWSSLWQKRVELFMTKMGGTHCCKNGWSSLWQKWVELTVAKIRGGLEYHPCMLSFFFK